MVSNCASNTSFTSKSTSKLPYPCFKIDLYFLSFLLLSIILFFFPVFFCAALDRRQQRSDKGADRQYVAKYVGIPFTSAAFGTDETLGLSGSFFHRLAQAALQTSCPDLVDNRTFQIIVAFKVCRELTYLT